MTNRMVVGAMHEKAVAELLRQYGCHVHPFGQQMLDEHTRDRLRLVDPPTPLRWLPDMVVSVGGRCWLVDAKDGRKDTPNYAIEDAALQAHKVHQTLWGIPFVLVWGDFQCSLVDDVLAVAGTPRDGAHTAGSGTPYHLVPKLKVQRHLAEVFVA